MYKLYLFDFDGTILDSDEVLATTFYELYAKYRPSYHPPIEHTYCFSGPPIKETLLKEFPSLDQNLMFDEYIKYSNINYVKYARAYPYVKELLSYLKSKNIKFGLITSKMREATNYALKIIGLEGIFDFTLCADEVSKLKPDPEGIVLAMQKMNVKNNDEVCYIGDNMYDYLAAKNAKVKFGYVTFSPRKLDKGCIADLYIADFKSFKESIENENN